MAWRNACLPWHATVVTQAGIARTSVALARNPEGAPLIDREALQEAIQEHQRVPGSPDVACGHMVRQQQEAAARSSPHPRRS